MKIQINSKEVLERLIGDDKEMEVVVKNSIINQFAKQYLKSVANSEIMDELKRAVIREVKEESKDYVVKSNGWVKEYIVTNDELRKAIVTTVKESVSDLIRDIVKEQFASLEQEVKDRLGYATDSVLSQMSEKAIERTMREYLRKKLDL